MIKNLWKILLALGLLCIGASYVLHAIRPAHAATFSIVQAVGMNETSGSGSYSTSNFTSSVTAGNAIVCAVSNDDNVANETTNITDTRGNTFARDVTSDSTTRENEIW